MGTGPASASGDTLEVVAAWEPLTPFGVGGTGVAVVPPAWNPRADLATATTATVNDVLGAHPPAGLRQTVRVGYLAQELIEASRSAPQLVVGSRGRGAP